MVSEGLLKNLYKYWEREGETLETLFLKNFSLR